MKKVGYFQKNRVSFVIFLLFFIVNTFFFFDVKIVIAAHDIAHVSSIMSTLSSTGINGLKSIGRGVINVGELYTTSIYAIADKITGIVSDEYYAPQLATPVVVSQIKKQITKEIEKVEVASSAEITNNSYSTVLMSGVDADYLERRLAIFRNSLDLSSDVRVVTRSYEGNRVSTDRIYEDMSEAADDAAEDAVTGGDFSFSGVNGTFSGEVSIVGTLSVTGTTTIPAALVVNDSAGENGYVLQSTGIGAQWVATSTLGIDSSWGSINGLLSSQTDLQNALDLKLNVNSLITGASKTKITYDANGLVTSGADATTADIVDSPDRRYVSDVQLAVLGNTSGINTGDQTLSSFGITATASELNYVDGVTSSIQSQIDNKLSVTTAATTYVPYVTPDNTARDLYQHRPVSLNSINGTGTIVVLLDDTSTTGNKYFSGVIRGHNYADRGEFEIKFSALWYSASYAVATPVVLSVEGSAGFGSVRFAYDNLNRPCLLIGTTGYAWHSDSRVTLEQLYVSYSDNTEYQRMRDNAPVQTISRITSETGYTIKDTKPVAAVNTFTNTSLVKVWGGATPLDYRYSVYNPVNLHSGSNTTGTVAIKLPAFVNTVYNMIDIKGYDYTSTTGGWKVTVSGLNTGASWVNSSVNVEGKPPFTSVRLAYIGADPVILLGATTTAWTRMNISLDLHHKIGATTDPIYSSATDYTITTGITNEASYSVKATYSQLYNASPAFYAQGLGTAALPVHSFFGDPNTGVFSPAADNWAVTTNGTERFRIDSAGKVGIGGTPSFPLDVASVISSAQTYGYLNSSGTTGTTSGTADYSIRAVGRILASEFNAVSDGRLKDINFNLDSDLSLGLISQLQPLSFNWKDRPTGQPILGFVAQDVEGIIPNAVSQSATNNFGDQRTLDYNQLVAVSVGAIKALNTRTLGLESKNSTITMPSINIGTEGNVGIGTDTPQKSLHVVSVGNAAPARFEDGNGYCEISPTLTAWTCTSDERLKTNIISISGENALTKIMDLRPVTFAWKTDETGDERIGLIAQEVEQILPSLVNTDEDGYKSVAYGGFTAYIISAAQELNKQLADLRDKFTEFTDQLAVLQDKISQMTTDSIATVSHILDRLTVGSAEQPTGITLYDEETGEPYCVVVRHGSLVPRPGDCSDVEINQPQNDQEIDNNSDIENNDIDTSDVTVEPSVEEDNIETTEENVNNIPVAEENAPVEDIVDEIVSVEEETVATEEVLAPEPELETEPEPEPASEPGPVLESGSN